MLPSFTRFAVPSDFISSSFMAAGEFIITALTAFRTRNADPASANLIMLHQLDWLHILFVFKTSLVVPLENALWRTITFHPVYRSCWGETCWWFTLFPTKVLARFGREESWVCWEVVLCLLLLVGGVWLGVRLGKVIWRIQMIVARGVAGGLLSVPRMLWKVVADAGGPQ
jgi:hypothetical protein